MEMDWCISVLSSSYMTTDIVMWHLPTCQLSIKVRGWGIYQHSSIIIVHTRSGVVPIFPGESSDCLTVGGATIKLGVFAPAPTGHNITLWSPLPFWHLVTKHLSPLCWSLRQVWQKPEVLTHSRLSSSGLLLNTPQKYIKPFRFFFFIPIPFFSRYPPVIFVLPPNGIKSRAPQLVAPYWKCK